MKYIFKNNHLALVLAYSLISPLATHAASVEEMKDTQAPLAHLFKVLDKNGDQSLVWSEIKDNDESFGHSAFMYADKNGDKQLSPGEYASAKAEIGGRKVELYIDDSIITAEAKAALLAEKKIESMKISVETYKGEVILSGFVGSSYEKKLAEQLVADISGVNEVVNSIVVIS